MDEIVFQIETCEESGVLVASLNAPLEYDFTSCGDPVLVDL